MDVRMPEPNVNEHVFVAGRHSFESYRHFVQSRGTKEHRMDEHKLAQTWREMQQQAAEIDAREFGLADGPQFLPIPEEMSAVAEEAREKADPQRGSRARLAKWWLVEIDRCMVFQPWVDLDFVRDVQSALVLPVSPADHIAVSTGRLMTQPVVGALQRSDERFVFTSRSTDVRFLGATLLDPSAVQGGPRAGHATHVVAAFFGSGVNCLSAVHINNRLLLTNGTHRAYALRELGLTHVACLVTHVRSSAEKNRLLPPAVKEDEARYFGAERPPLFKDYFDPAVRKIVHTANSTILLKLRLKHSLNLIPTP